MLAGVQILDFILLPGQFPEQFAEVQFKAQCNEPARFVCSDGAPFNSCTVDTTVTGVSPTSFKWQSVDTMYTPITVTMLGDGGGVDSPSDLLTFTASLGTFPALTADVTPLTANANAACNTDLVCDVV
jgi:hypothetical protein